MFLKLWSNRKARGEKVKGWLYRVAVRASLDELRRRSRRARYESLFGAWRLKPASERKAAPDFELKDAEGKNVQLSALKGRVVVLNFWATWCHGCEMEIPSFVEVAKKYADSAVMFVGVSMDDDGWKSVKPWIKEKGINYPIVIGNSHLAGQYGLVGMPLTVLIDRDGRVAGTHPGLVDKTVLEQQIQALLQ